MWKSYTDGWATKSKRQSLLRIIQDKYLYDSIQKDPWMKAKTDTTRPPIICISHEIQTASFDADATACCDDIFKHFWFHRDVMIWQKQRGFVSTFYFFIKYHRNIITNTYIIISLLEPHKVNTVCLWAMGHLPGEIWLYIIWCWCYIVFCEVWQTLVGEHCGCWRNGKLSCYSHIMQKVIMSWKEISKNVDNSAHPSNQILTRCCL